MRMFIGIHFAAVVIGAMQLLHAQQHSAQISNVELKSENEVVITYNLSGDPNATFEVELVLLSEKDPDFELDCTTLSGDIGKGKFAGQGRSVKWNFGVDFPRAMSGEKYKFKLIVSQVSPGGVPWYVYAGGSVLVGGLAVLLTSKKDGSPPPEKTIPLPPSR